jgi:hypothetical protein
MAGEQLSKKLQNYRICCLNCCVPRLLSGISDLVCVVFPNSLLKLLDGFLIKPQGILKVDRNSVGALVTKH